MGDSKSRYAEFTQRLVDAVLATPGDTPSELRRAIMTGAARLGPQPAGAPPLPAPLAGYIEKVALHAYKVTDADVAVLRGDNTDDALFEMTVAAALGASLGRLERGLAALRAPRD